MANVLDRNIWHPTAQVYAIVTGAAAATDITVADANGVTIKTYDQIVKAYTIDGTDLLTEASVTADGKVQFSTTSTASKKVIVEWVARDL